MVSARGGVVHHLAGLIQLRVKTVRQVTAEVVDADPGILQRTLPRRRVVGTVTHHLDVLADVVGPEVGSDLDHHRVLQRPRTVGEQSVHDAVPHDDVVAELDLRHRPVAENARLAGRTRRVVAQQARIAESAGQQRPQLRVRPGMRGDNRVEPGVAAGPPPLAEAQRFDVQRGDDMVAEDPRAVPPIGRWLEQIIQRRGGIGDRRDDVVE